MKPGQIKGILFDFDGVLGKTMEDNFNAWRAVLAEFDVELKGEEYYPLEGTPLREIAKKYCSEFGLKIAPEEIVKRKEEHYIKNHSFSLYPGVEKLIKTLKSKKIRLAVVSAALHDRLVKSVPKDFLEPFDAVITGEKTERGKPFPDPYLKGLSELRLSADKCIVVENAPIGIRAAKNAGLYCIAICSTMDSSYLEEADETVENFEELMKLSIMKNVTE